MREILKFCDRAEFMRWLSEHCLSTDGVWTLIGKTYEMETVTAEEALEEAS